MGSDALEGFKTGAEVAGPIGAVAGAVVGGLGTLFQVLDPWQLPDPVTSKALLAAVRSDPVYLLSDGYVLSDLGIEGYPAGRTNGLPAYHNNGPTRRIYNIFRWANGEITRDAFYANPLSIDPWWASHVQASPLLRDLLDPEDPLDASEALQRIREGKAQWGSWVTPSDQEHLITLLRYQAGEEVSAPAPAEKHTVANPVSAHVAKTASVANPRPMLGKVSVGKIMVGGVALTGAAYAAHKAGILQRLRKAFA